MNNKDRKRTSKKNARKVILLKYKDMRDTFVLTRTVKRRKESLKIIIECNTQPVKDVNRTVTQNEKYPIFRAQLEDRIVPRCTRDKCRRHVQCKTEQCRLRKQMKSQDKAKSLDSKKKKARTPSLLIEISDEECDGLEYDDISSESSWSVDEIDALMESTRKRMKDSDEEWKILPRQTNLKKLPKQIIETKRASRSPSLHSLDTFVLDAMEIEVTTKQKLNTFSSEFKHDRVKRKFTYESRQSLKRKECFEINGDEHCSQLNTSANSKIVNPEKKRKLEPLKINLAKLRPDIYYESLPKEGFQTKQETSHQPYEYNAAYLKVEGIINQNIIKPEPPETNNNIINEPNYVTRDREDEKSVINYKTKNEIDAVITKLEKYDTDYYGLNLSLIDIKQELYSDI